MRATLTGLLPRPIGIAIGADQLFVVGAGGRTLTLGRQDGGEVRVRPLEARGPAATWPDLADAFRSLREDVPTDRRALAIALLPPLVRLRRLELPPLTDAETRGIVERGASKYFTGVREPQVVGIERGVHRLRRSNTVITAAAPARLIAAIIDAAHAGGWIVSSIVPAHAAWIAGARAQWPELGREAAQLAVLRGDSTELLRAEQGAIAGVRQFGAGASRVELLVEAVVESSAGGSPLPLLTIGPEERRAELIAPLAARGVHLGERAARWRAMSESPDAMAAAFAPDARGLDLLPEQAHAMRDLGSRRRALMLAAAAAVLLLIGAGARFWDARRELAAVQARRAEIRSAVTGATDARVTIETLQRRLGALVPIEAAATRWSSVLVDVAAQLPRDAYLVRIGGAGDSLGIEGIAARAAGVFERLDRAPSIHSLQPAGAIRHELTEGGTTVERFSIRARLARDSAAAATAAMERR